MNDSITIGDRVKLNSNGAAYLRRWCSGALTNGAWPLATVIDRNGSITFLIEFDKEQTTDNTPRLLPPYKLPSTVWLTRHEFTKLSPLELLAEL